MTVILKFLRSLRPQILEVPLFYSLLCSVLGLLCGFNECEKEFNFHNQYNLLCKIVHVWI